MTKENKLKRKIAKLKKQQISLEEELEEYRQDLFNNNKPFHKKDFLELYDTLDRIKSLIKTTQHFLELEKVTNEKGDLVHNPFNKLKTIL